MPIKKCSVDGKPGYKWGDTGKCYTYIPGNEASMKAAKKKAIKQAVAASYKGGKQVTEVDLASLPGGPAGKNLPLAVCSVCGHEEYGFIDGVDPVLASCTVCGGFMHDPFGYRPVMTTEEAISLHFHPWKE